ncbi:acyl-lipid (7-3)-desaturase [Scenedesmus sp. PABB004]|nr:acyl-lipid (7-3)-desaturase [Scenedesmus sp. PABB004]
MPWRCLSPGSCYISPAALEAGGPGDVGLAVSSVKLAALRAGDLGPAGASCCALLMLVGDDGVLHEAAFALEPGDPVLRTRVPGSVLATPGVLTAYVALCAPDGSVTDVVDTGQALVLPPDAAAEVRAMFERATADVRRALRGGGGGAPPSAAEAAEVPAQAPLGGGAGAPEFPLSRACQGLVQRSCGGGCGGGGAPAPDAATMYAYEHFLLPLVRHWAAVLQPGGARGGGVPAALSAAQADGLAVKLLRFLLDSDMWASAVLLLDRCPAAASHALAMGLEVPGDAADPAALERLRGALPRRELPRGGGGAAAPWQALPPPPPPPPPPAPPVGLHEAAAGAPLSSYSIMSCHELPPGSPAEPGSRRPSADEHSSYESGSEILRQLGVLQHNRSEAEALGGYLQLPPSLARRSAPAPGAGAALEPQPHSAAARRAAERAAEPARAHAAAEHADCSQPAWPPAELVAAVEGLRARRGSGGGSRASSPGSDGASPGRGSDGASTCEYGRCASRDDGGAHAGAAAAAAAPGGCAPAALPALRDLVCLAVRGFPDARVEASYVVFKSHTAAVLDATAALICSGMLLAAGARSIERGDPAAAAKLAVLVAYAALFFAPYAVMHARRRAFLRLREPLLVAGRVGSAAVLAAGALGAYALPGAWVTAVTRTASMQLQNGFILPACQQVRLPAAAAIAAAHLPSDAAMLALGTSGASAAAQSLLIAAASLGVTVALELAQQRAGARHQGVAHRGGALGVGARAPARRVAAAAPRRSSWHAGVAAPEREVQLAAADDEPAAPIPAGGDPWEDAKWTQYKWTVYRGVAYDLTSFVERHPAGSWLINLAIGRDCTALFESYHLRPEVAVGHLKRLPVLEGFPVDAVPRSPYPNDSEFYNAVRDRVRVEVFKGAEVRGAHRTGSEAAAATILGSALAAYALYAVNANLLTGTLLGLTGAWIGLTVQHCGNHGAMSTRVWVNQAMGLCSDLIGGSSLMWRYHHQVSHHIHCNDDAFDEDVFSAFPILRFDPRLPRAWYHQFQHIYMWATFPLLQIMFQVGDVKGLLSNRTGGATLYGATEGERRTVLAGKLAHYGLLLGLPALLHGPVAALVGAAAYNVAQSIVLSTTFAVSHNVPESKPLDDGPAQASLEQDIDERDWGLQQVLTSANWGGVVGNFMTGGLNLQARHGARRRRRRCTARGPRPPHARATVSDDACAARRAACRAQIEHHLFPAISFMHYPAIAAIVQDECAKRGVQYARYDTLPEIMGRFVRYMKEVGAAPQAPARGAAAAQLAKL